VLPMWPGRLSGRGRRGMGGWPVVDSARDDYEERGGRPNRRSLSGRSAWQSCDSSSVEVGISVDVCQPYGEQTGGLGDSATWRPRRGRRRDRRLSSAARVVGRQQRRPRAPRSVGTCLADQMARLGGARPERVRSGAAAGHGVKLRTKKAATKLMFPDALHFSAVSRPFGARPEAERPLFPGWTDRCLFSTAAFDDSKAHKKRRGDWPRK